jgi:hypothetical protein
VRPTRPLHISQLFNLHTTVATAGSDHPNVRRFLQSGWPEVTFPSGLAILSKQQAYDDTDSAFSTQMAIEGAQGWDEGSDSWIP